MAQDNEVTLTIHGLAVDNGNVLGEVFVTKLKALIDALRLADRHLNERKSHDVLVVGLHIGSAAATLRERVSSRERIPTPGTTLIKEIVEAVYNGDRHVSRYPTELITSLQPLVSGVGKKFSHGEIRFENNIIRIDDFLASQLDRAVRRAEGEDLASGYYEGVALETYDGIVKQMDSRGSLVRGVLVLTIGGKEIDCVFKKEDLDRLRASFDLRARVEAVAHYDGTSPLPSRLDVRRITLVEAGEGLLRWRGGLSRRRDGNGGLDE